MRHKFISFAVCVLLLVMVITVGAQDTTVLRVASTATVTTWDPSLSFSTEALYMANIYEPLLWVNAPGSAEDFTPALATSWETSEDGMTWTFHLREGVKFHDGANLTAGAVKRSVERTAEIGGADPELGQLGAGGSVSHLVVHQGRQALGLGPPPVPPGTEDARDSRPRRDGL